MTSVDDENLWSTSPTAHEQKPWKLLHLGQQFLPNREWALHPFLADDLEVLILIPATAHLTCRSTSSVIYTARHNLTDKDGKGWIMAAFKKMKVNAECRIFQEKWTNYFFFFVKGKPVCFLCGEALAIMKRAKVEHSYSLKHAKLDE